MVSILTGLLKCGLKQGCPLSAVLFSFFINDLALKLKSTNVGVVCWEEKVNNLLFADDIVLIAENPNDLQVLLNILSAWCKLNGMVLNGTKSNNVHPQFLAQIQFYCWRYQLRCGRVLQIPRTRFN